VVSAEATTATIPAGHQVGDFLLGFAFRDGSTTNPSIPAGWTTLTNTFDGTTCSASLAWKAATSGAESSGTWSNATGLIIGVFRGVDMLSPVIDTGNSAGTTNTVSYAGLTPSTLKGASYYIGAFAAHRSTDVTLETPPTGMTNILKGEGATNDLAMFDATARDAWLTATASISGTASGWQTVVFGLRPARVSFNNYQFMRSSSANAGVLCFSERIR
jgi:hypothetical protein